MLKNLLASVRDSLSQLCKPASRMELYYQISKINSSGEIKKLRRKKSHSWLIAAAYTFSSQFAESATLAVAKDTGGTPRVIVDPGPSTAHNGSIAAASDNTHGVQVGTGSTAEAKDDNVLATLIADGAAAGEMEYSAVTVFAPLSISGGYRIRIQRQFDNDSGGDITVNEIGLVTQSRDGVPATRDFLMIRDVISGGQVVSDATGIIVEYQIDFLV